MAGRWRVLRCKLVHLYGSAVYAGRTGGPHALRPLVYPQKMRLHWRRRGLSVLVALIVLLPLGLYTLRFPEVVLSSQRSGVGIQ